MSVSTATVKIHLGGALGKRFGPEWELCVKSPAEAIRAIDANTKGAFRRYLSGPGGKRFYKVALARKDNVLDEQGITGPSGRNDIYILPTVKGAKSGLGKVLAGIALIALAVFVPGVGAGLGALFGVSAGTAAFGVAMLGASLTLGGITQMLTPTPSFDQNSVGDSRGSNIFAGNTAAVSQGGCVGLAYGRVLVSPMPISLSFTAVDQSAVNSFAPGEYEIVQRGGGIVDYVPIPPEAREDLPAA